MKNVLVFNLTPRLWMLHYSAQFCNELSKTHNVTVVIADYYDWFLYDKNIKLIKIKTNPKLISFFFETLAFWNHITLLKNIKRTKPDIIHFIDNHPRYIFYWKLFKKQWYKIYVTQHDPVLHSWDSKWLLWKVASYVNYTLRNLADKLVVHWDKLKDEVIKLYKIKKNKVISVPHGNYNFFTKRSKWLKVKNNYFLFFWRISEYKWLDTLLESLKFIKEQISNFKLIIAGWWDLTQYNDLINSNREGIEVYNYNIPEEEVYKYFEQSEFVVLPYKDATWSGVIPTAFAFSKAVITTDVGELATHVHDKKSWLIVPPNDPKKLADAIIWMLHHKKEVEAMGGEWKKHTEDVLGWDKIVRKIYG